jgi:tripeptidyl-peptidase-1
MLCLNPCTFKFLTLTAAAQVAFATPLGARTAYSVKETHDVPQKWTALGRASADHKLHMKIGLKQERFDELERHLYEGRICQPSHREVSLLTN